MDDGRLPQSMRYLVQLLIPTLILLGVIWVIARSRRGAARGAAGDGNEILSTPAFLLILVIGAALAVALLFAMGAWTAT